MQEAENTLRACPNIGFVTFDNGQDGRRFQYQRYGSSSSHIKVTTRALIEGYTNPLSDATLWVNAQSSFETVPITYLNQKIPSPAGMPSFEDRG